MWKIAVWIDDKDLDALGKQLTAPKIEVTGAMLSSVWETVGDEMRGRIGVNDEITVKVVRHD